MKQRPLLKLSALSFLLSLFSLTTLAGHRYDFNYTISRPVDAADATLCPVYPSLLKTALGVTDPASLKLVAGYKSTSGDIKYRTSNTPGVEAGKSGHWFDLEAVPTNRTTSQAVQVVWESPALAVTHSDLAAVGTKLSLMEGFVNGDDSLFFHINITFTGAGSAGSVVTDQPQYVGRASETDGWLVTPLVQKNDEQPLQQN